jgi:predicted transposase YdaD
MSKVLRKEKELIRQVEDEKERADLLSIAMTLAFHYFKKADWVREYFREEVAMIKTANIVQEWIDEGIQQGIQEGIQQGIQEGIQQGRQEGIQRGAWEDAQESIREVLEARFHLIPDELVNSIRKIDEVAVLHKLLKKAAVINSLEEFEEGLSSGGL